MLLSDDRFSAPMPESGFCAGFEFAIRFEAVFGETFYFLSRIPSRTAGVIRSDRSELRNTAGFLPFAGCSDRGCFFCGGAIRGNQPDLFYFPEEDLH